MIVGFLQDYRSRLAVRAAALPDEDTFFGERGLDALHRGFVRVVVRDDGGRGRFEAPEVVAPVLTLGAGPRFTPDASGWIVSGIDDVSPRLRSLLDQTAGAGTWVDTALADMARTAGFPLPPAFRGLCRRVLEYPAWYPDLHAVSRLTGLSRGAVKARFRRRALRSPSGHLRWLRSLAAAHVLADPGVNVIAAAYRLGFTSGGNLCRAVHTVTGLTPGKLRSPTTRVGLLVRFVERFLHPGTRGGWVDLEEVFLRSSSVA
jgi:AraC-like DNA-binding protein